MQTSERQHSTRGGWLFLLAFGLLGAGIAVHGGLQLLDALEARGWPQTTATILDARIERRMGAGPRSTGASYPVVRYRYRVGDREYIGHRIGWAEGGSTHEWARSIIREYRPGATVPVYYDPRDPSQALLRPGLTRGVSISLLLGVTFMLMAGGMAWVIPAFRRRPRAPARPRRFPMPFAVFFSLMWFLLGLPAAWDAWHGHAPRWLLALPVVGPAFLFGTLALARRQAANRPAAPGTGSRPIMEPVDRARTARVSSPAPPVSTPGRARGRWFWALALALLGAGAWWAWTDTTQEQARPGQPPPQAARPQPTPPAPPPEAALEAPGPSPCPERLAQVERLGGDVPEDLLKALLECKMLRPHYQRLRADHRLAYRVFRAHPQAQLYPEERAAREVLLALARRRAPAAGATVHAVPRLAEAPRVDGVLDEAVWRAALTLPLPGAPAGAPSRMRLGWHGDALYAAVTVSAGDLPDPDAIDQRGSLSLLLQPGLSRWLDYQYFFVYANGRRGYPGEGCRVAKNLRFPQPAPPGGWPEAERWKGVRLNECGLFWPEGQAGLDPAGGTRVFEARVSFEDAAIDPDTPFTLSARVEVAQHYLGDRSRVRHVVWLRLR